MNIIKFKGCRKCGGDLFQERDSDGIVISCLQCGATFVKPLKFLLPLKDKNKIVAG
jgi:hypothetical protein